MSETPEEIADSYEAMLKQDAYKLARVERDLNEALDALELLMDRASEFLKGQAQEMEQADAVLTKHGRLP